MNTNTQSRNLIDVKFVASHNTYDLSGPFGVGYTAKGDMFLFDKEDYDKVNKYCWYYNVQGYVTAFTSVKMHGYRHKVLLHRLVMEPIPEGYVVDHLFHSPRHGKKFDNRKCNLAIKTPQLNAINHNIHKCNTSGVPGVHRSPTGKWIARIGYNNERIALGTYSTFEEAVAVRLEAERKYYGNNSFNSIINNSNEMVKIVK